MPIEIVGVDGANMNAPVIFCDHCGERITDAATANIEYLWATKEKRTPYLFFLHKACDKVWRQGRQDHPLDGVYWHWVDLAAFLDELAHNVGHAHGISDD
jgi:hypothetical protein